MNNRIKALAVFVLVSCLVAGVSAQGRGGGGGQRFGGRNGGDIGTLLNRPDVQKELNLTDDQKTKLKDAQQAMRDEQRALRQGGGQPDPAKMQEMRDKQTATLKSILTEDQFKRVTELSYQRQGITAVLRAEVQKALGLSEDQITKLKDLQKKQGEANRELGAKVQSGEITREDMQAAMTKNQATLKEEVEKVLSADQKKKFEDMKGKPFTFDPDTGGRGGV